MHSEYLTSSTEPGNLPQTEFREVSFIGRSNTGKSTLINALTANTGLARSGSTPGQTRMINFFLINNKVIFADLPGYGFAKGHDRLRKTWATLVDAYLLRPQIEEFLFLVDSRRELDKVDLQTLRHLQKHIDPVIIFTKADKLKKNDLRDLKKKRTQELHAAGIGCRNIFVVSALNKDGIEELRQYLEMV